MHMRWISAVIGCGYLIGSIAAHAAADHSPAEAHPSMAQHALVCGNLKADAHGYGPWNYNDVWAREHKIPLVEQYHFTPPVEKLEHGQSGPLGNDLDYTLRRIPNHHRALYSMLSLAIRDKTDTPPHSTYTMQCWFQRAKKFAPKDGVVWMLQGIYQNKLGHHKQAIALMQKGAEIEPKNPNIHYNLGLLYADAEEYEKAREQAHIAYQAGFPLPGLKQKLIAVGQWKKTSDPEKK